MRMNLVLPDEYRPQLEQLADKEYFGNMQMLIRFALLKSIPELKEISTAPKQRKLRKDKGIRKT